MSTQPKIVALSTILDEIKGFFSFFLRQKKLVGIFVFIFVVFSLIFGLLQGPKYDASTSFVLEEKTAGGGGLAGLASQFGFDMSSLTGAGSGLFSGDNILDIVKSRVIVEKVLLSKVDSLKGKESLTLADLYLQFSPKGKGVAQKFPGIQFSQLTAESTHSTLQDSILFVIYDDVTKNNITVDRLNKKGSIYKITTVSDHPVFSKNVTDKLLSETTKFYVNIKTNNASANVARLQKRADSLYGILNAKSYNAANYQILDPNIAYKSVTVPGEVSQRDKTIIYSIYAEVVKNLEMSRMAVISQTPIIQILDQPKYPLIDQRKSFIFLLIAGAIIGFVISFLASIYIYTDK